MDIQTHPLQQHNQVLFVNPELTVPDPLNPTSQSDFRFDRIVRSLVSEVEDQRKVFDKKWQMLMQYLLRKHEEQEATIRKLRQKLSQYESFNLSQNGLLASDDVQRSFSLSLANYTKLSNDPLGLVGSQNMQDIGADKTPEFQNDQQTKNAEGEDIQNFDQLQSQIMMMSRAAGNDTALRNRRVYSVGIKKQNVFGKEHRSVTQRTINEFDFVNVMKSQLLQAKQIIQKDKSDKLLLVNKLKEMKGQLNNAHKHISELRKGSSIQSPLDNQNTQEETQSNSVSVIKVNQKTQTNQTEFESKGLNTSFDKSHHLETQSSLVHSSSQVQIKVLHDEFEETRLRENVNFWKEKVDLLLQEKKEALHEQMTQHKLIRNYESQIEEFKAQLRSKDDYIECLQMEKDLISQKLQSTFKSDKIHSQSKQTLTLNQDLNEQEIELFSEEISPKRDKNQLILSHEEDRDERGHNSNEMRERTKNHLFEKKDFIERQNQNWAMSNGISSEVSASDYNQMLSHDKQQNSIEHSNTESHMYEMLQIKSISNSNHSSLKKKQHKKSNASSKIKKNSYLNPPPGYNTKIDANPMNVHPSNSISSTNSSALKSYEKRNYDIINKSSLNQIYAKFAPKMPLLTQQTSQSSNPDLIIAQHSYQQILKHNRNNSGLNAIIGKNSRDTSLSHSKQTQSTIGFTKNSSRNIMPTHEFISSSSNSIISKVSHHVNSKNSNAKQQIIASNSKRKASSRQKSRSKSKGGKIKKQFGDNEEKVQVIENESNQSLIESVIQTVQFHQNSNLSDVLDRINSNEEPLDKRYLSPSTHAQQILNSYKNSFKEQNNNENGQKQSRHQQFLNSFIENEQNQVTLINEQKSVSSHKSSVTKPSSRLNSNHNPSSKNIMTNYQRHNLLSNKNSSNISLNNNISSHTLGINNSNSSTILVGNHQHLPIQNPKRDYKPPFL